MMLNTPTVDSSYFTMSHERNRLIVEKSSLPAGFNTMSRLYDDRRGRGFSIKSKKTGNVETFSYLSFMADQEGELLYSIFSPLNPELRATGFTVIVLND